MKTKKSRVVLSSVSVLLVLSLLAGMTMAWFTDTEKVNANFTAGVLDISVKPGETDKGDLTFENLRPMLYDNFYKELEPNGNEKWVNDVTQDKTTDLEDTDYAPVPAYFKPVTITNEGTLPTKVKLSLEIAQDYACKEGEKQFVAEDLANGTMTASQPDSPICENKLEKVLKVFVYKQVGETWTKVEDVNLNTAYDEAKANPDEAASGNTAKETNNTYMTTMLPAQGTATYVIAGYLPETVDNAYQGKHYHSKLVLNAYQMDDTDAGVPDEGGSSSTDPEEAVAINSEEDLKKIGQNMDGDFVLNDDITLTSDWTPLGMDGDSTKPFTGTFDGQGHTISGLNVSKSDKISVGLFAVNSGTIQDVNIVAEEILGSSSVGAVAGSNEAAGTLLNVHVTAEGVRGQSNVGGLVGTNRGNVSRCSADTTVTVTATQGVGGFAGDNSGVIEESWAVTGINVDQQQSTNLDVGGFVGSNQNSGTIRNCYVIARDTIAGLFNVGGFASLNQYGSTIENCYAVTTDKIQCSDTVSAGVAVNENGTIKNCYAVSTAAVGSGEFQKVEESALKGTLPQGFDASVWTAAEGEYPQLANNPQA